MILRTFNCTIVNQIKSSKKTYGKIENKKSAVITDENYFPIIFRPSAVVFAREICARSLVVVLKPRMSRNFLGGFYQLGDQMCVHFH